MQKYPGTFLESCVTEEADGDNDRVISFAEAYQYAHRQLPEQPPRIFGPKAADINFAPLPPLSRLSVKSEPSQAMIVLNKDTKEFQLDKTYHTPAMMELPKGLYDVHLVKEGFLIPEARKAEVTEYNSLYALDAFQLEPVKVVGKTSVSNSVGESVPVSDGLLTIHVKMGDDEKRGNGEVHQQKLPADGKFQFDPSAHDWLVVGSQYEIQVTGKPVLSSDPVPFTYGGNIHVNRAIAVILDDIPPILAADGVKLKEAHLVAGEKLQGTVHATDDGLGLTETISIRLQPPDEADMVTIPASGISFQPPSTYEFSYVIPEEPASAGEWCVAAITLEDRAGNTADFPCTQLSIKSRVFVSRYALGRYYFDSGDHAKALEHFKQISSLDDDSHYFSALSHHYLDDLDDALKTFRKIKDKSRYLGKARSSENPQMPRKMVNRFWGELLDNLKANSEDASYLELLSITAEELGKSYEAKIYGDRAEQLREAKK